jgi:ankyrin repeat protein
LHIAAKANKPQICELILNTIGHSKFLRLHYGDEEWRSNLNLAQIMLDLYLNTPDKGLNETPLHFAAKFGYKDVVRVLISYAQCIKTLQNKYEQMPIDVCFKYLLFNFFSDDLKYIYLHIIISVMSKLYMYVNDILDNMH